MSKHHDTETPADQAPLHEIRLKGHLGHGWADWFDGMAVDLTEDGDTLLTGPVVDQAPLHGILKKVADLGLAFAFGSNGYLVDTDAPTRNGHGCVADREGIQSICDRCLVCENRITDWFYAR